MMREKSQSTVTIVNEQIKRYEDATTKVRKQITQVMEKHEKQKEKSIQLNAKIAILKTQLNKIKQEKTQDEIPIEANMVSLPTFPCEKMKTHSETRHRKKIAFNMKEWDNPNAYEPEENHWT